MKSTKHGLYIGTTFVEIKSMNTTSLSIRLETDELNSYSFSIPKGMPMKDAVKLINLKVEETLLMEKQGLYLLYLK